MQQLLTLTLAYISSLEDRCARPYALSLSLSLHRKPLPSSSFPQVSGPGSRFAKAEGGGAHRQTRPTNVEWESDKGGSRILEIELSALDQHENPGDLEGPQRKFPLLAL